MTAPLERTSFSVHRCRFVDWNPSEITAIAFSPLPPPNSKASIPSTSSASQYGVLAVGRGNGCIELCEWARPDSDGVSSQGWTVRRVEYYWNDLQQAILSGEQGVAGT
jgi:U3 small nucleolar RNA-associated protein 4